MYLHDLLNIGNPYFEEVNQIIHLKAKTAANEAPFCRFTFFYCNGFVSSKIYDKRDDINFDKANFPFLWCIQLIRLLESAIMLRTSKLEINV